MTILSFEKNYLVTTLIFKIFCNQISFLKLLILVTKKQLFFADLHFYVLGKYKDTINKYWNQEGEREIEKKN